MRDKTFLQNRLRELQIERRKLKSEVSAKKLNCNGTFGKLGSPYCAFYSPDLMLAVTVTGQLNLACLISEIEKIKGAHVVSANTDGILVRYPKTRRQDFLQTISENAVRTGFEYEEMPYSKIAMKDVNSYINIVEGRNAAIISPDGSITESKAKGGKVKAKGMYADASLMKNPTAQVCSKLAADYLKKGILPRDNIQNYTDIRDYVEIRNVKGGGVQYEKFIEVDDWVLIDDKGTKDNAWVRQAWIDDGSYNPDQHGGGRAPVKRKSRPAPVQIGVGGDFFGRLARWYKSKAPDALPINYAGSGNKVAGSDNCRLCLNLPDGLPEDLDVEWYVKEAERILDDIGVDL